jgi:hypothetical protein
MSLTATPGSASADTFATLAEFETYAANRLPAVSWFATASDPRKEAALRAACRSLEACFDWTGAAVDATQNLTWPRVGMVNRNGFAIPTTVIPQALKDAQCEFALQLGASDRLGNNDPLDKGITSLKAGSVALTFSDVKGHQASSNMPTEAVDVEIRRKQSDLNYVSNVVPDEVRRLLVASWFNQNMATLPIVFESFGSDDCN